MRPVFLIGYMGAGKTTLGRSVATATGLPFIDLDDAITAEAGMGVSEIFKREGEEGFRRRETAMLRRLADTPAIIACGGGTPLQPGNMELMNSCGTTVWLQAGVDRIVERLILYPGDRPLIRDKDADELRRFVSAALHARSPRYSLCTATFDANLLDTPDQLHDSTQQFITRFLN